MRSYDVMTIHRPDLAEDQVVNLVDGVGSYLVEHGATVSKTDRWGKRRFAYEIKDFTEGYYSVVTFEANPKTVEELDRMLTLTDEVIRHKIVRPVD
jgi:small subunit ribosomal protein S6